MNLAELTPKQLRALRPQVGARMQEQIDARIAAQTQVALDPEPKPSRMNKTEQRWARELDADVEAGRILSYHFESVRFRLGHACTFTPDFLVRLPDGRLRVDEVKGPHIREDARIKFKLAPEMYPWIEWRLVQWKQGRWTVLYHFPASV